MCWLVAEQLSQLLVIANNNRVRQPPDIFTTQEYLLSSPPPQLKSQQLLILKLLFWCTSQSDRNICKIARYFVSTPSNILVRYLDTRHSTMLVWRLKLEGAKNRIKCPETIQLTLWLWHGKLFDQSLEVMGSKNPSSLSLFRDIDITTGMRIEEAGPSSLSNTSPSLDRVSASAVISR